MSGFNTTIGTVIGAPFISNHPFPIDNRMVVDNEAGRLSIPKPVQFEGMIAYQKDNDVLYVLNTVGTGTDAVWTVITTSGAQFLEASGSAQLSGSLQITGPTTIIAIETIIKISNQPICGISINYYLFGLYCLRKHLLVGYLQ
mgnify:CR=1 FL=1